MNRRRALPWTVIAVAALATGGILYLRLHHWRPRSITFQGAVIRRDQDTRKETPITGAQVTASDGAASTSTLSDSSGYFRLTIQGGVWPQQIVHLSFRHSGFEPLNLQAKTSLRPSDHNWLYVAAMTPIAQQDESKTVGPQIVVSNVRVRYTENSKSDEEIGSAVKTFQLVNQGNLPCSHRPPCSPDGRWKAAKGSVTLDAGASNEFRNVRASCIAGPCPFTQIDLSGAVNGNRTIEVTALDWSDTATFLVEAEVYHAEIVSNVRQSYPVIFGRTINFTLPPTQEGASLEADLNGTPMVFPLGADLYLSWANCTQRTNAGEAENGVAYRCELKPGFRF